MSWGEVVDLIGAIWTFELGPLGDGQVTVGDLAIFAATLVVAFWVSGIIQRIIGRLLGARGVQDEGTVAAISRLAHYAIMIVGAVVALETLGFDLTGLLAAGAILGIGLGLAMQDMVQNFLSGVILLMEQSITPGDVLSVDGRVVLVEEMRIRTTIARTWDDDQLIIPNATLVQGTVINYTLSDALFRIRTRVGVAYESDLDLTKQVLVRAAERVEARTPERDPVAMLFEFGDSSVVFDVSIWVENPWVARGGRSELNFAIWRGLKDAGITIAFPQLDVHFDQAPGYQRGPGNSTLEPDQ